MHNLVSLMTDLFRMSSKFLFWTLNTRANSFLWCSIPLFLAEKENEVTHQKDCDPGLFSIYVWQDTFRVNMPNQQWTCTVTHDKKLPWTTKSSGDYSWTVREKESLAKIKGTIKCSEDLQGKKFQTPKNVRVKQLMGPGKERPVGEMRSVASWFG